MPYGQQYLFLDHVLRDEGVGGSGAHHVPQSVCGDDYEAVAATGREERDLRVWDHVAIALRRRSAWLGTVYFVVVMVSIIIVVTRHCESGELAAGLEQRVSEGPRHCE